MNKIKVICFVGTRPEAIKMAPVLHQLRKYSAQFEVLLCSTGQHKEMLADTLFDFELTPDIELSVMQPQQTLAALSSVLFPLIDQVLVEHQPDWVLLQGDTTTVVIASLCAFYRRIKIGHIEAGLRTYNKDSPFPEEMNRQVTSLLVDLHFTPTECARQNLLNESIPDKNIINVGNTVIDALFWTVAKIRLNPPELPVEIKPILANKKPYILITGHRRENFGQEFVNICDAIKILSKKFPEHFFIYPVHLNPNIQKTAYSSLSNIKNIILIPPQIYPVFIYLMDNCQLILTDSGGIQEEAPSLNKPVLVMRNTTERPEGIEVGVSQLVGTNTQTIVNAVVDVLTDDSLYLSMQNANNPYGDGYSREKIIQAIINNQ